MELTLYWSDLSTDCQESIIETFKERGLKFDPLDMNWDVFPMTTIEIDVDGTED